MNVITAWAFSTGASGKSVTAPYTTPSIAFDINNVLQRAIKTGTLSAGALVINDKAGDGELTNLGIMGSIAYARPLTSSRKVNISIGLQPDTFKSVWILTSSPSRTNSTAWTSILHFQMVKTIKISSAIST
jgi:hypothetical protein